MRSMDFRDFYIKYKDHPSYSQYEIIEDDVLNVIVQKYEMILFTNKGEVLGDPNFGADLLLLLHETKVSSEFVEGEIISQINIYIPEINNFTYSVKVVFSQDNENFQDVMFIYFEISDYTIYAQIGVNK